MTDDVNEAEEMRIQTVVSSCAGEIRVTLAHQSKKHPGAATQNSKVLERARRRRKERLRATVLFEPSGKAAQLSERELIQGASDRFGIEKLVWHD
jgi:hypothetical protein